jgi:hypothetical protein
MSNIVTRENNETKTAWSLGMLFSPLRLGSLVSKLKTEILPKLAFAFGVAAALYTAPAYSQALASTNGAPATFAKHCEDIKMVFEYAKFKGDYKKRVDAFLEGGCTIAMPIPSDPYNSQRFTTAAGILQNGGGIVIAPN